MSSTSVPALPHQAGADIGYDPQFEKHWCTLERTLWVVFICLLIIGLLGLLGRGPLNKRVMHGANHLTAQYEQVIRYHTPTMIEIQLPVKDGSATLLLERPAIEKLGFRQMQPQPTRNLGSPAVGPFLFTANNPSANVIFVELTCEPASVGPITSRFAINGESEVILKQFMVP